jgi:hypothetical protein
MRKDTQTSKNKIQPLELEEATNNERENWGGKLDFFLSALSYSVGLGAKPVFQYFHY